MKAEELAVLIDGAIKRGKAGTMRYYAAAHAIC